MWTCPKCDRIFQKANQPHSCKKVSIEAHFANKEKTKELFDCLVSSITKEIGAVEIVSIPCCVHLFGSYDFLAALPKKEKLEVRFALDRKLDSPRVKQSVPMSANVIKNCIDITTIQEIDKEFIGWLSEAYHLKDKRQ